MIRIVTHYYPPVVNPPANRMSQLARVLVGLHGADGVQVITGRPNHPHGVLPREYRWRLFKRRRGAWGEQVLHLYEVAAPNEGFFRKTLGYVSFAKCLFLYLLFMPIRDDDVLLVTSPPVFTAYAVYAAACLRRRLRYVLDVRDLWPQAIAGIGFLREDTRLYRFFSRLSDRTYRRAQAVIGVSEGINAYVRTVIDRPDERLHLVHNPVDLDEVRPLPEADRESFRAGHPELFGDGRTTFLFAGMHSIYIDLMSLVRALPAVRARTDRFRVILIGYGEQKAELEAFVRANGLESHVAFLPFMKKSDLIRHIDAADFCYVSLKSTPTLRYAIPTKTLEYLACGKHVLAALEGPFAEMLKAHGVAHVVLPGDPEQIAGAVLDLIVNRKQYVHGEPLRRFVEDYFSLRHFEARMSAVVSGLHPTSSSRSMPANRPANRPSRQGE